MDTVDKEASQFEYVRLKGQLPNSDFLNEIIDVLTKYIDKRLDILWLKLKTEITTCKWMEF
mgnify:CR=1 FL=1